MGKGRMLNPTDAFRKAEREKEKKRNRKERVRVREESMLRKDPSQIKEELAILRRKDFLGQLDGGSKKRLMQLEAMWNRLQSKIVEKEQLRRQEERRALERREEEKKRQEENQSSTSERNSDSSSLESDSDDQSSDSEGSEFSRKETTKRGGHQETPLRKKGRWDVAAPNASQMQKLELQGNKSATIQTDSHNRTEDDTTDLPPEVRERLKALRTETPGPPLVQSLPQQYSLQPSSVMMPYPTSWFPFPPPPFSFPPHLIPPAPPTVPAPPSMNGEPPSSGGTSSTQVLNVPKQPILPQRQPQSQQLTQSLASTPPQSQSSNFPEVQSSDVPFASLPHPLLPFPFPRFAPLNPMLVIPPVANFSSASQSESQSVQLSQSPEQLFGPFNRSLDTTEGKEKSSRTKKVALFVPTQLRVQQRPKVESKTSVQIPTRHHSSLASSAKCVNQSMLPNRPTIYREPERQTVSKPTESSEDLEKAFQEFMNEVSQS